MSDSTETDNTRRTGAEPARSQKPRIRMSADGLIEESAVAESRAWGHHAAPAEDDPRTLAELAASVTRVAEEAGRGEEGDGTSFESAAAEPVAFATVNPAEPSRQTSGVRRAAAVGAMLLLLGFGAVIFQFETSGGGSDVQPQDAAPLAAAPPGSEPPGSGSGDVVNDDSSNTGGVAVAPTPEPAQTPAPTPGPAPAPAPTTIAPTAPPAPAAILHVADLSSRTRQVGGKVKVAVQVLVHDSNHNPVAGVTVSGAWSGASGAKSCTTGADGVCSVETTPVQSGGSVTFTVSAVGLGGGSYDAALNHDPDGDSDGTSITVSL